MKNEVVGWTGLVASLLFVGAAVALSSAQRLRLERPIVVAVARSLLQLLLVGAALGLVLDDDTPLAWSWLWVVAMVAFAGLTVARRAPALPRILPIAVVAHALLLTLTLSVVFGFGIFDLEARTLVPVAGMTIGNAMNAGVVGANRLVAVVADHRAEIEARLALGLPGTEALRPFLRSILRTAITPQVEQTAALGIVVLPGTMTGLLLAGVDPMDAVRTQLALMYVILAGVAITSITTVLAGARQVVTPDDRLLAIARRRE